MSEKLLSPSQPINFNRQSSDNGFELPYSPCEPGVFNFYRIHQGRKRTVFNDELDAPTLSALTPSIGKSSSSTPWSFFVDCVPNTNNNNAPNTMNSISKNTENVIKISTTTSSLSTSASSASLVSNSSIESNTSTSSVTPKSIHTASSSGTLTDLVRNAMHKGALSMIVDDHTRLHSSCLTQKELNHLVPQSM
ncbi:unnamed protein product [Didymodactylos carnosus]|uniref:Uncharacterized protein n=1 Tax=Didymodactylos carnosus TaxID=1234261 RepID=A0A814SNB7_9BILA|nr:unnamed protein product [Didymodactylos carnosus]CAF1213984.1 unnamed protein product [Didymodactylos carnosus]CAF3914121.1 unnamed protein product [Didymodactylos carnosus]CAF4022698.1 unnamed protein product [Didymodactylos carnosus]